MSSYQQCLSKIHFDSDYSPVFFDVGCNINFIPVHCGVLDDFTSLCLSKASNAKCYGIEPLHWQKYEEKYKDNPSVKLIKKALSDKEEARTLYIPGPDYEVPAHAISSFWNRKCFTDGVDEVEVECTTIDKVMEEESLSVIDYLKIDTEGAELLILNGAKNALADQKINMIQVEHGGTYDDAGYSISDVTSFLDNYGYKLIFQTGSELLFAHTSNLN